MVQAERAEREEVALRALLSNMRHDLNRALQASNGLERNMHQLTQSNVPARAESLQCIQVCALTACGPEPVVLVGSTRPGAGTLAPVQVLNCSQGSVAVGLS